jgi:hypothetical protein
MTERTPDQIEADLTDLVDDLDEVLLDTHPVLVLGALGVLASKAFAYIDPEDRSTMLMTFIHTLTGEVIKSFEGEDEELH